MATQKVLELERFESILANLAAKPEGATVTAVFSLAGTIGILWLGKLECTMNIEDEVVFGIINQKAPACSLRFTIKDVAQVNNIDGTNPTIIMKTIDNLQNKV
jgi:hypothetical protein